MPRGSDEENDGAESVGAASSVGTWRARRRLLTLPILLGGKLMVCVFCGHNSSEKNPLVMGGMTAETRKWMRRSSAHLAMGKLQ